MWGGAAAAECRGGQARQGHTFKSRAGQHLAIKRPGEQILVWQCREGIKIIMHAYSSACQKSALYACINKQIRIDCQTHWHYTCTPAPPARRPAWSWCSSFGLVPQHFQQVSIQFVSKIQVIPYSIHPIFQRHLSSFSKEDEGERTRWAQRVIRAGLAKFQKVIGQHGQGRVPD